MDFASPSRPEKAACSSPLSTSKRFGSPPQAPRDRASGHIQRPPTRLWTLVRGSEKPRRPGNRKPSSSLGGKGKSVPAVVARRTVASRGRNAPGPPAGPARSSAPRTQLCMPKPYPPGSPRSGAPRPRCPEKAAQAQAQPRGPAAQGATSDQASRRLQIRSALSPPAGSGDPPPHALRPRPAPRGCSAPGAARAAPQRLTSEVRACLGAKPALLEEPPADGDPGTGAVSCGQMRCPLASRTDARPYAFPDPSRKPRAHPFSLSRAPFGECGTSGPPFLSALVPRSRQSALTEDQAVPDRRRRPGDANSASETYLAESRGPRAAALGRRRPLAEPLRSRRPRSLASLGATPLNAGALQNINNQEGKKEKRKPSFPNSQINFSRGWDTGFVSQATQTSVKGQGDSRPGQGARVRTRVQTPRGAQAGGAGSPPAGGRRRHYLTWSRRLIPAQGYEAHQ
uniref:Uncharacterized protein LOC109679291 n=1 Tax=Castor canadensis TaxID=51338 RepID=A0A8B7TTL5_CASCN|nr:uncharacterized protein LOC109679291 [Castor canadensis]